MGRHMSKELGDALREARIARGLKVKDVAAHVGLSAPAVSQWEAGKTEPTFAALASACELLELDQEAMVQLFDRPPAVIRVGDQPDGTSFISRPALLTPRRDVGAPSAGVSVRAPRKAWSTASSQGDGPLARDVPVLGIAVGGEDGDFSFNGSEIDRVSRPAALANVADLFAIYLNNDSMYPAWRENAVVFIAPSRHPSIGDDVVIELKPGGEGEPGEAYLKRLVARGARDITVEQFNPPKTLSFPRDRIKEMWRVVPYEEALGLS